jgi:hypothetical protein
LMLPALLTRIVMGDSRGLRSEIRRQYLIRMEHRSIALASDLVGPRFDGRRVAGASAGYAASI